jgi:hypothetical protein
MKKLMSIVLLGTILVFTACSSDDDSSNSEVNDCETCDLDILGTIVSGEYCDNGDGTITVTIDGQEETESLDGLTFDQFISAFEQLGATCN